MTREANYWNALMNQGRMSLSELRGPQEAGRAAVFVRRAQELAAAMDIPNFPEVSIPKKYDDCRPETVGAALYEVEIFLGDIYARNVFIIYGNLSAQYINLDESWRTRVSTLLNHVRDHVRNATLEERLRTSIMHRLNDLQSEVDRTQTRVSAAMDVLVEVCEGLGAGAEALKPAVRLLERVVGAFRKAQRSRQEGGQQQALPPPDVLSLPPSDAGTEV